MQYALRGRFSSPAELCRHSAPWMSYAASHRSNAEIPAGVNARRDYNAEGRRLVEALGLQVGGNYNAMDAIWKESSTGGKIYVGNETAARGPASTLAEHGITHVVNCTDDMANFCEGALLRAAEPTCCRRAAQSTILCAAQNTIVCPPPRPPKPTRRSQSTCQYHAPLLISLPRRAGPLLPTLQRGLLAVGRSHAGRAYATAVASCHPC